MQGESTKVIKRLKKKTKQLFNTKMVSINYRQGLSSLNLRKYGNLKNLFEKIVNITTTIKVVFIKIKESSKLNYSF